MRVLRTALVAAGAATVLFAFTTPANAFPDVTIEGESGTVATPGCGDGGDGPMGPANHGTTTTMFFPSGGCSATYSGHLALIQTADYRLSGIAGVQCGNITITGITTGTARACANNDTPATASFGLGVLVGPLGFTVSWSPDNFIVNLWLDNLKGLGV